MDLLSLKLEYETIETLDDSFVPDPIGYFILHKTNMGIRCEHYNLDDMPDKVLTVGDAVPLDCQAEAIRKRIIELYPSIDMAHYGYLCQELGRLQASIDYELPYTQV